MSIITTAVTRPWGLYGALALSAAMGAGLVWQTLQLASANVARAQAEKETEAAKRGRVEDAVKHERVSRETMQAYRELESALTATIRKAEHAQAVEKAESERVAAGLRAERDRLRDDIAAFAAGGRSPTEDTLAACRERAAALGALLEDGLQVQIDLAAAASTHAADVRALRASWPTSGEAP